MSTNLYMEAIQEAQQLKAMAEQNAKNKIIEALTPKIQAMVEAQLLSEQPDELEIDELEDDDLLSDDVVDDVAIDMGGVEELPVIDDPALEPLDQMELELMAPDELVDDEDGVELDNDASVVVNAQGDVNVSVSENSSLSRESGTARRRRNRNNSKSSSVNKLIERNIQLRRKVKRMDALLEGVEYRRLSRRQRAVIKKSYTKLLDEMINLRRESIVIPNNNEKKVRLVLFETLKEMKQMTDRRSRAIFNRLFEAGDSVEELDEMDLFLAEEDLDDLEGDEEALGDEELEGEEAVEGEVELDAAQTAIEDLGVALGLDVVVEPEGEVEDEEDLEGEEGLEDEEGLGDLGEVYEIDPRMLKRELRRLRARRLQEQEVGRAAAADPALAHGGDDEGDVILDVSEDDLINALADELGDPSVPTPSVGPSVPAGDAMPESYRRRRAAARRRRVAENRRRAVARKRSAGRRRTQPVSRRVTVENKVLKRKLSEMNLFNAKLLYVNKLMQNRNVSSKQQRAIVEALDSAKTIREAKLVYDSLTRSLKRRSLSEGSSGRRVLGSASRPTRSAGSTSKGAEHQDRWAVLAGIDTK
jgi:hypothetical protein